MRTEQHLFHAATHLTSGSSGSPGSAGPPLNLGVRCSMATNICYVFLTEEATAFLEHSLISPCVLVESYGRFVTCESAEQVGSFMVLTCTPETTPNIKGAVSFSIPVHLVRLVASGESTGAFGFTNSGAHDE